MVRRVVLLTSFAACVAGCGFSSLDATPDVELPEVYFAIDQSITDESIGTAEILLQLSEPSSETVTVGFSITGGSAAVGSDLRVTEGKVTFPPNTDHAMLRLAIVDDGVEELEEDAMIVLDAPEHAVLGEVSRHDLRISATKLPRVRFAAKTSAAGEEAGPQRFAIELDRPSAADVVVGYRWTGTAEDADHGVIDGVLTIPPGRVSVLLDAPITNDPTDEDDETLDIVLLAKAGAVVAPGEGEHIHTILDDDLPPTIGFASTASTIGEAGGTVTLDVSLSLVSEKPITVGYASGAGATAGVDDFTLAPGTLTFPPGTRTLQVQVTIIDDMLDEPDETIAIALSDATNATLPPAAATHLLTITDDDEPPPPPPPPTP
jgi:hypothetical protein